MSALATLALLSAPAAAVAKPTVYAECPAFPEGKLSRRVADRFCGWLLLRLLDEGYTLVRDPLAASRELRVVSRNDEFLLLASGAEQRSYAVPSSRGDVGVVELLHRGVDILREVGIAPAAMLPSSLPMAAVVSAPGSDPDASADVRAQVVQILSDQGVVVTPHPGEASTVLCLELSSQEVHLGTASNGAPCDPSQVRSLPLADASALKRGVTQALGALPPGSESKSTVGAHETAPPFTAEPRPGTTEPRARGFDIGLGVGTLGRSGGVDPMFQVDASLPIIGEWRGRADVGLSFAAVTGLRVLEPALQLGVFWSHFSPVITVGLGLSGGTRIHSYYFTEEDQGLRVNWLGSGVIEFGVTLSRFVVHLALQPGVASTPPTHLVRHAEAWQRGNLFCALLLGVRGEP